MILYEEIYFEITFKGEKSALKKMEKVLKSGILDDFFEVSDDYFNYADDFSSVPEGSSSEFVFTNDDYGIEADEFDVEEFLDIICSSAKKLDVVGHIYDISDDEYSFISEEGDSSYINKGSITSFNDELDEAAAEEESDDE